MSRSEAQRAEAERIVLRIKTHMAEREFQKHVVDSLKARGFVVWVFPIMKRTVAGVPDLTFWHPQRPGRLYCWELKTEHGRIRPEQIVALAHLSTGPGIDARIVKPSEWPALLAEIDGEVTG